MSENGIQSRVIYIIFVCLEKFYSSFKTLGHGGSVKSLYDVSLLCPSAYIYCCLFHAVLEPSAYTSVSLVRLEVSQVKHYWNIIALQCCVSFRCVTQWISDMSTCTPSLLNLPPTRPVSPPTHPSRSSRSIQLSSLWYTAVSTSYFTYGHAFMGFACGSAGWGSACNAGDLASILGLERSPGEGKGYLLQDSGLENSMDCIGIVCGVAKSPDLL